MKRPNPGVGPYYPAPDRPVVYCMVGDEPLMFQPERKLNPFQRQHVASMRTDILVYTLSLLPSSKPGDVFFLSDRFQEEKDFLRWHLAQYRRAGLKTASDVRFAPAAEIYPRAIQALRGMKGPKVGSAVCYSYELAEFADVAERLRMSRVANSKIELLEGAASGGYEVPRSIVLPKRRLTLAAIRRAFPKFPREALFLKTDGLGGGFNVRKIKKLAELEEFTREFGPDDRFILQARVDGKGFREMISDFIVRTDGVELVNTRLKLTASNQWFGNLFDPSIRFSDAQANNLLRCVNALRAKGYHSPEGYICGVDFFQDATRQYITEVNARWTGGYPIARLLERFGILHRHLVPAHLDLVQKAEIPAYRKLVEKHLYRPDEPESRWKGGFRVFPVSFSPVPKDGGLYVWIFVVGDYDRFLKAKRQAFSESSFPLSEIARTFLPKR